MTQRLLARGLDATDEAAARAFHARYGKLELPPVVVVIAAYEEKGSIGRVLDELPAHVCGLSLSSIVVVDGGTDDTASVAGDHGAYVCEVPTNRGQGAALRLGYALARSGGAHYIVTTDADGQYVGSEIGRLLAPLVAGEADVASGSRWLGRQETTDRIRRLGSRVFARLASLLTGQRITDTSFGCRAMTAEVTASVVLRQPQYQSAELLMEAFAKRFRFVELPMTIRRRSHGQTKKGSWVVYGSRYAKVLIGTWLRERRRGKRVRNSRPSRSTIS
jgi:glycosyltransferase involved in cell wall biosynthesis